MKTKGEFQPEQFTKQDKKILVKSLWSNLVSYLGALLVLWVLLATGIGMVSSFDLSGLYRSVVMVVIILFPNAILFFFIVKKLSPSVKELRHNQKLILKGVISGKSGPVSYSYSLNTQVDAHYQPRHMQGYVEIEGNWIPVGNENFEKLEKGDLIKVELTPLTKIILSISKPGAE